MGRCADLSPFAAGHYSYYTPSSLWRPKGSACHKSPSFVEPRQHATRHAMPEETHPLLTQRSIMAPAVARTATTVPAAAAPDSSLTVTSGSSSTVFSSFGMLMLMDMLP
mmetsp:Transcript_45689/g.95889  ORF Transcript_45689/g.95889 Transcript_45689/m.95889 type:complete len:109 (-) Transcript_45689:387-713(-)